MLNRSDSPDARRQQLSSLMDGDGSGDAVADACALWRQDAQSRADWHAWHLIGDVLRSDELAARPARDEAFLQALRVRLADEPVPFAPQAQPLPQTDAAPAVLVANGAPVASMPGRRRHWLMAPAAMAAGFMAVAGVMLVLRGSPVDAGGPAVAKAGSPGAAASAVLVRSAQLDRYLSAHRALANGAPPGAGTEQRVYIVFEGQ